MAEPVLRAAEGAGRPDVGVGDACDHICRIQVTRITADFCVTESVDGEAGLENLRSATGDELVGLARGAEVLGIEGAATGQRLGMPDADGGARRSVDLDPDPAGQVLAEVDDLASRGVTGHDDRPDLLGDPDGRPGIGDELAGIPAAAAYSAPARGVVARGVPAIRFLPQVLAFAHHEVGVADRSRPPMPLPVGDDVLAGAIVEGDS